jgi:DNA-binding transcriptional MerR regulator/effector-binding domain-containing protein
MARTVLLRIGAFARASTLSVKALRVYHESGLLVPSVIDPQTGYRAYSPAQLTDAAIIRLLREVGVSLADIRAVLDARDLGLVRKVLAGQAERYQAGLDAVARLIDDLSLEAGAEEQGVTVRREAAAIVLAVEGSPLVTAAEGFVRLCATTLGEAALASGAVVDGCFGACWPAQSDDERQDVMVFLPISAPVMVPPEFRSAGVRVDELPACDVAVMVHRGPYSSLDSCFRRLGAWVAFHAVPAGQPVRELYLRSGVDLEDYSVTEVLWPVIVDGAE